MSNFFFRSFSAFDTPGIFSLLFASFPFFLPSLMLLLFLFLLMLMLLPLYPLVFRSFVRLVFFLFRRGSKFYLYIYKMFVVVVVAVVDVGELKMCRPQKWMNEFFCLLVICAFPFLSPPSPLQSSNNSFFTIRDKNHNHACSDKREQQQPNKLCKYMQKY